MHLQELAEADAVKEHIHEVQVSNTLIQHSWAAGFLRLYHSIAHTFHDISAQELYGDFMVIDSHHFVVPCARNEVLLAPKSALQGAYASQE
jgi:hypothetical protein